MFYINWYNQYNRDWVDDYGFDTYAEAKEYLESQGYVLNSGWFRRKAIGWEGDTRALIGKLRKYTSK